MLSIGILAIIGSACGGGGTNSLQAPAITPSPASSAKTGIIIPLYVDPGPIWDQVIAQKEAHPRVPFLLIANPNNGPGSAPDPNYSSYIAKAQGVGIVILGYVYTSYGTRPIAAVETEIAMYRSWYGINGIFLDEMATNDASYYAALTAYAHTSSLFPVVGNPGTDASAAAGTDIINFYEAQGYPTLSFLSSPAHTAVQASTWSYIAGDVPFDPSTLDATLPYVGWLYATDAPEPESYVGLPSYWSALITALDR